MKIKLMERNGKLPNLPKYQTKGSCAMDLEAFLESDILIKSGRRERIPTGLMIELEGEGFAALVLARSSLASNYGICPANGVGLIDSDYRGEIIVVLQNNSEEDFMVRNKDRIAQLMIVPIVKPVLEIAENLSDTERGQGGFGSTDKVF